MNREELKQDRRQRWNAISTMLRHRTGTGLFPDTRGNKTSTELFPDTRRHDVTPDVKEHRKQSFRR